MQKIGEYAFYSCALGPIISIPSSLEKIPRCAFARNYLYNVHIEDFGVRIIGPQAFANCSLRSIFIPRGVEEIGAGAFGDCTALTNITIPSGVTEIGSNAFEGCSSLASVTVEATTPPTLGVYTFSGNASGRKIYVPSASVSAYQAASGWSTYAADIEAIQ